MPHPPRVQKHVMVLDGRTHEVTLVRDSKLCRYLTKKSVLVIGNTMYFRDPIILPKVMYVAIKQWREQHRHNFFTRVLDFIR